MNFRKASIFQRDTEKPEEQNDSGGMLAVWGSSGSGKTITAVKIAKMLSARKKNVILLLCDMAAPMLPCICPADALESNGSLAGVLAAARISENLIKHNLVTFKRNSCLAVLGLLERQNEYSTPPFTQKQVVELLDGLRQIAPYVIVDCGSYIANDILSAVALMEADSILRLANCDPKSVNYFASQLPLLDGPEWDMDKQYKVASNVKPYQAADHIGKVLGEYESLSELNYLAGQIMELRESDDFWQAVLDLGENTGSVQELINLTENLDCFDYLPGVRNDYDLGYYWIEESGCYDTSNLGALANYIDYEGFGRDIRFDESGVFTDNGYVRSNGGRFVDIYDGRIENIPEEYRIQSPNLYVRAAIGRTEQNQDFVR